MRNTWWFHWAGRLVAFGALSLAGPALRADEDKPEAAKPEAEKPPASERKADPKEGAGDNSVYSIRRREAPAPQSGYWLGIVTYPAQGLIRDQLNLPEGQGLVVESLMPDSPADKAALKRNDILLTANDKPLEDQRQLIELLRAADGSAIHFKLLRGGKELALSITPGKRADYPSGHDATKREHLAQAVTLWREFAEKGGEPIRMQFVHPGMVLPPGAARPPLPEGMRVTITREGQKPAQIEVKQIEESWSGTEDELSKAPEKFRGPIATVLGPPPPGNATFHVELQGGAGGAVFRPEGPGQPDRGPAHRPDGSRLQIIRQPGTPGGPSDPIDQRLQEVIREVEKLRQELHNRRLPKPPAPPTPPAPVSGPTEPAPPPKPPAPPTASDKDSPPPKK